MILDTLKNKEQYASLHPRFKAVFDYINTHDLASMELGRHDIDGDNIFVMVQELELRPYEQARLELHRKYIDIQLVLRGKEEVFGWSEKKDCLTAETEFDEAKDIQLFTDKPQCFYTVREGQFSILFPEDGHAPMLGEGVVKKCIFKILL
jgi:YhcH/YjgK/YiaL family protein